MNIPVETESFVDLLPDSVNTDPNVLAIGGALDTNWEALLPIIDQVQVLTNIQNQPENILDLLAFQFGVLFYAQANLITDPDQRLALKQQLVGNSFGFIRKLGTPQTIQQVISTIYSNAFLQEWWEYGGTHDHFRILTDTILSSDLQTQIYNNTVFWIQRASQAFDGFFTQVQAPVFEFVSVGIFWQTFVAAPLAKAGLLNDFIAMQSSMVANASVKQSSSFIQLAIGASVTPNNSVFNLIQPNSVIQAKSAMTASERILRNVLALVIRAGR